MKRSLLRIGVSVRLMHPDGVREILPHKTIEYAEASVPQWILTGGALPLLIPSAFQSGSTPRSGTLEAYAHELDGLVLQGGADVAPETYGEQALRPEWAGDAIRDQYELALVEAFLAADKPILGICRGCQLLNVAFGGTLYQDIATQITGSRTHRDGALYDQLKHRVKILPQSRLAQLYPNAGLRSGGINSIHHQSIKDVGDGLVVEAVSHPDRIIEAVRLKGSPYVRGIQWHPEFVREKDRGLLASGPLLAEFLAACRRRRKMSEDGPGRGRATKRLERSATL